MSRRWRSWRYIVLGALIGLLFGIAGGEPGVWVAGALLGWIVARLTRPREPVDRSRATFGSVTRNASPPPPLPAPPPGTSDPVGTFLLEALNTGAIDHLTYERLLALRRGVTYPATAPAPAGAPSIVPAAPPAPIGPPVVEAEIVGGPAEPVEHGPSAFELRLRAIRDVIASDIAVHGLTYLGALLLFAGAFGFVVFSFGSVRIGLRPVAEIGVPAILLAAAWYLRRRGAPFVATAIGLVGGVLLPIFLFASFVDGVAFPPDLTGAAEIVALILVSVATAAGYAVYARRVPQASVVYLVVPALWLAAWSAGLVFNRGPDGGVSLQRWSAAQLATVACAVAASALVTRLRPEGRLAAATRVVLLPGIAVVYGIELTLAASEGWPAAPVAVAGAAVLFVTEVAIVPPRFVAAIQPLLVGVSVLTLGPELGTPWTGAVAVVAFIGTIEWLWHRRPDAVGLALAAGGLALGLAFSAIEPWPAVAAFAAASIWAHVRRPRPDPSPVVRTAVLVAAASLPVAVGGALIAALPDGAAAIAIATSLALAAGAVRVLTPSDGFYRIWLPAAAAAGAILTFSPSIRPAAAAAAAGATAVALVLAPGAPAIRTWLASVAGGWAVWSGAQVLGLGFLGRAVLVGVAGAALVAASGAVRRDVGPHLGGAGIVATVIGVALAGSGWSRTGCVAAAVAAATAAGWWAEAREDGPVGRAATWLRERRLERLADAIRSIPVVAIAVGLPFLLVDVAERSGVTDGRRSWNGVVLAMTGLVEAVVARRLAGRPTVGPLAAIGAFATGVVGISVAAPDPWPVIVALGTLVASTWLLGGALRRPAMTWIAWIASGALVVLLAGRTGVAARDLWIAAFAWGVLALIGGLALDEMRGGRRASGEGVRLAWLWPPVALGALAVPSSLAFAFTGPPSWYAGWSLVAALVYVVVARQLRAGLAATPAFALVTLAAYTAAPPSIADEPFLLYVPWAALLILVSELVRRASREANLWARWDLGSLIVAHLVAGIALPLTVTTGDVPAVWTGFGVLALSLGAVRVNAAWGLGGAVLLLVAAAVAGPGWLALACAVAAAGATVAAIRTVPPLRRACQGAAVAFIGVAWGSFLAWTGWVEPRIVVVNVTVGALLLIGPALALKLRRLDPEWAFMTWILGLGASSAAVVQANRLVVDGAPADGFVLASAIGAISLALGSSASRLEWRAQREVASGVGLFAVAVLLGALDVRPVTAAVLSAIVGLGGIVVWIALWRVRPRSPWIPSAIIVAVVGDVVTLLLAASILPRGDVLEAALLLTGVECATAGLILRRTHLVSVSPLFAAAAWLIYASDAFRGEVQWFTVPSGLALLALAAIERDGRTRAGRNRLAPELLAVEYTGMALLVVVSLVEIVSISPVRGLVAIVLGAGLSVWGATSRVRRRAAVGSGTVVLAVLLLLTVPIARLVPQVRGPALWLVLAGAGLVFMLIATMLERGRAKVRELLVRLDDLTEGWE